MKKILIVLSIFAVLVMVIIIAFPLVVDLNKYKPQIEQEINKKIQGEFRFEKIGFRGLGIQVKNIVLTSTGDFRNKKILEVGEVKVKISFLSLLTANPKITVILRKPEIYLVKNEKGLLNITSLNQGQKKEEGQNGIKSDTQKDKPSKLPALIVGAKISLLAENAMLKYLDEKSNSLTIIKDLLISFQNVSFNSPIDFNLSAYLTSGGFEEKVTLSGSAKLLTHGTRKLKSVELDSKMGIGSQNVNLKGNISDLDTLQSVLIISAENLSVQKLKNSLRAAKQYNLDGDFSFNGEVKGPLKNLKECVVDAKANLKVTSSKTDLTLSAVFSQTLSQLNGNVKIQSSTLDMDSLFPHKLSLGISQAYADSTNPSVLMTLRTNAILKGLTLDGHLNLQKIIYKKTEFRDLLGEFDMDDLVLSIPRLKVNAFKGLLTLKGQIRMDTLKPTYQMTMVGENFQTNSILTMTSPTLKDVLMGTLNTNLDVAGEGFALEDIKKRLSGTGKIDLKEVELKGLNMGKEVQEKLKLIAIFSGSEILNEKLDSRINSIRSSIQIREGKLYTPDAVLEAPAYGAALKGYASFEKYIDYQGNLLIPAKKLSSSLASLADSKGMVPFPFVLTGTLPKISFNVDASKVAQMVLRSTIKEGLTKKAKEKLGIDLPIDLPF